MNATKTGVDRRVDCERSAHSCRRLVCRSASRANTERIAAIADTGDRKALACSDAWRFLPPAVPFRRSSGRDNRLYSGLSSVSPRQPHTFYDARRFRTRWRQCRRLGDRDGKCAAPWTSTRVSRSSRPGVTAIRHRLSRRAAERGSTLKPHTPSESPRPPRTCPQGSQRLCNERP